MILRKRIGVKRSMAIVQVLVQSDKIAGKICLKAISGSLKGAEVVLNVE